jgi:5-methylcytosine-specific restriction endonuclease McrA
MAFGVGEKGRLMAEGTCYEKLRSLESKGFLRILGSEREGTRLHLYLHLPSEIEGVIQAVRPAVPPTLEEMDFFNVPANRLLILQREGRKCFYCLRALDSSNYVIEHVVSRPEGDNSYRNVVAACRDCNNRKGDTPAEDFIRGLYRKGHLQAKEMEVSLSRLQLLLDGELRPNSGTPISAPGP